MEEEYVRGGPTPWLDTIEGCGHVCLEGGLANTWRLVTERVDRVKSSVAWPEFGGDRLTNVNRFITSLSSKTSVPKCPFIARKRSLLLRHRVRQSVERVLGSTSFTFPPVKGRKEKLRGFLVCHRPCLALGVQTTYFKWSNYWQDKDVTYGFIK